MAAVHSPTKAHCSFSKNLEADASQLNRLKASTTTKGSARSSNGIATLAQVLASGRKQLQACTHRVNFMVKPNGRLVQVSYAYYYACTSCLSTR